MEEIALGIDLGTSNSVAAYYKPGEGVEILKDNTVYHTPSVVAFDDERERVVGQIAHNKRFGNPMRTVHSIKRILGLPFDDPKVAEAARNWSFPVIRADDGGCAIPFRDGQQQTFVQRPQNISTAVLSHILGNAQQQLKPAQVYQAVITVPASFTVPQCEATEEAARAAGIEVLGLLKEPYAAACCFGMTTVLSPQPFNLLVFDLGGGTLDIAVLSVPARTSHAPEPSEMEVKGICGDPQLGGDNFTEMIMRHVWDSIPPQHEHRKHVLGPLAVNNARIRAKMWEACDAAKRELSQVFTASVEVDLGSDVFISVEIKRRLFEQLCNELFQRIFPPVETALQRAGISKEQVKKVLLVGGSTRIPWIQRSIDEYFHGADIREQGTVDTAVAIGAAMEAALRTGAMSFGRGNGQPEVDHRAASVPAIRRPSPGPSPRAFGLDMSRRSTMMRHDDSAGSLSRFVPPVRADSLPTNPMITHPQFRVKTNVLANDIGLAQGRDARMCVLAKAGSKYQLEKIMRFHKQTAAADFIDVIVVEGPHENAKLNSLVGSFRVSGLAGIPADTPAIEVSLRVSKNNTISVAARPINDPSNIQVLPVKRSGPNRIGAREMAQLQQYERQQREAAVRQQQEEEAEEMRRLEEERRQREAAEAEAEARSAALRQSPDVDERAKRAAEIFERAKEILTNQANEHHEDTIRVARHVAGELQEFEPPKKKMFGRKPPLTKLPPTPEELDQYWHNLTHIPACYEPASETTIFAPMSP